MTLREARSEDAAALAHLAEELGYAATAAQMAARLLAREAEREVWLVVTDATDRPIGFVHVSRHAFPVEGNAAYIGALVVDSACRRQGLGRRLMEGAERWARARDLGRVRLHSRTSRLEAHAFYRSLGYADVKTQLVLEKRLEPEG